MNDNDETKWYHGGRIGLQVGDILVPGTQTGLHSGRTPKPHVYVSPSFDIAFQYANRFTGQGCVYRVQPIGEIQADISLPEYQFHCQSARIMEVVKEGASLQDFTRHYGFPSDALTMLAIAIASLLVIPAYSRS